MPENTTQQTSKRDTNDTATTPTIDAPAESRVDEPIDVRITGARPGESVTVEATTTDTEGVTWRSTATFEADAEGVVDLSELAPTSGRYEGVAPMGWCWSMTADDAEDALVTDLMDGSDLTVRLQATADDATAERRITRTVVPDGVTRTEVDRDDLAGTVFEPPGEGPHPGVLVLHGSSGRPALFRAGLLAAEGFAAFAVHYADDEVPVGDGIRRVPLPYFDRAAEWFGERDRVAPDRLGVVGHSWGALAALLVGARSDWPGAVVSYNGSGVVWNTPSGEPAWIDEDGDPIPYVSGKSKPTLCEGQLDEADAETVDAATIPVEQIGAPTLLLSGGEDPVWPARRLSEMAVDRLRDADVDYAFEHCSYDDAGHFVTPPYLPKNHPVFGGSPRGIATADRDAWSTALEYLHRGIGEPASAGSETDGGKR